MHRVAIQNICMMMNKTITSTVSKDNSKLMKGEEGTQTIDIYHILRSYLIFPQTEIRYKNCSQYTLSISKNISKTVSKMVSNNERDTIDRHGTRQ